MKEEAILKIFGTGQITIPKKWREFFNTNTLKAVFDEKFNSIKILPVKMVELEDTKYISSKNLKESLDDSDFSDKFKKELLAGYEKSDFYKSEKK